ncbi:MAG: hypothetical protein ABS35_07525 [Kaistia sp. SCN 65-12]|nr:MAG: hypothetical protein ABS35_07525 [Kaistia sp. SCN 65-12]
MMLHNRASRLLAVTAAAAIVAFSSPAFSQEVPEAHLKAAHAAIAAIHATDSFDNALPNAAAALREQLIQKNPDLQELITTTVSDKALALAARRADLEKEAALVYAKAFSEQELNDIATFYSSEAGKKLLEKGPAITGQLVKAADIWQNGIARDLARDVGEALQKAIGSTAPAPDDAQAPPDDAAPAGNAAPAQESGD